MKNGDIARRYPWAWKTDVSELPMDMLRSGFSEDTVFIFPVLLEFFSLLLRKQHMYVFFHLFLLSSPCCLLRDSRILYFSLPTASLLPPTPSLSLLTEFLLVAVFLKTEPVVEEVEENELKAFNWFFVQLNQCGLAKEIRPFEVFLSFKTRHPGTWVCHIAIGDLWYREEHL